MTSYPEEGERFVFSCSRSHRCVVTIQHCCGFHSPVVTVMEEKTNLLIFIWKCKIINAILLKNFLASFPLSASGKK